MVPKLGTETKFMRGDVVNFKFSQDEDLGVTDMVSGRLVAKLSERCAVHYTSEYSDYFLMTLHKGSADRLKNEDDPVQLFMPRGDIPWEFEWGEKPKGQFICVEKNLLAHMFQPKMSEVFVEKGLCPRCGDRGFWRALALNCDWHGQFI